MSSTEALSSKNASIWSWSRYCCLPASPFSSRRRSVFARFIRSTLLPVCPGPLVDRGMAAPHMKFRCKIAPFGDKPSQRPLVPAPLGLADRLVEHLDARLQSALLQTLDQVPGLPARLLDGPARLVRQLGQEGARKRAPGQ